MSYYYDCAVKFNYDTYEEYLDYAMKYFESKGYPYEDIESLERSFDDIRANRNEVCVRFSAKYGSYLYKSLYEFVEYLDNNDRGDEYTFASVGEEEDDMTVMGEFSDMWIEREINTCMDFSDIIKPGTLLVDVKFIDDDK